MEFVVVVRYKAREAESGRIEAALKNMHTDQAGFEAHRSSAHFEKWLKGEVLPYLSERRPLFGVPLFPHPGQPDAEAEA